MSLPLWEECAWYVDVPDEDFEQAEFCESENGNEFYEEEAVGEVDQDDEGPAVEIEQVDEEFTNEVEQVDEGAAFDVERGGQDASCDAEQNADIQIEISDKEYISPADYHDVDLEYIEQPNESPDAEGNMPDANDIENQKPETMDDENIEAEPFANPLEEECCPDVPENEFFDIPIDIIEMEEEEVPTIEYKFPINRSINKRIYLYLGEIYKLPCDAIVIGQVENLMDRNDGNDVIFTLAGIELEPELRQLAPCGTGDSVITKGWQMPCEWIIHSVGPKYDERYLNAADHALFSAYKSALLLAAEKEVQSLVIGTIYKQSKNYPRFDAAHVALRTVRKFLEHSVGDVFDRVMFCVNTQEDFEIYSALMHAYFPRSEEELQDQLNLLPLELGDEWGEIIIKDRVVKVSVGPKPLPRESLQQYKALHDNEHEETASTGPKKLGGQLHICCKILLFLLFINSLNVQECLIIAYVYALTSFLLQA